MKAKKQHYSAPPEHCPHCLREVKWKFLDFTSVCCANCGHHHFTRPIPDWESGKLMEYQVKQLHTLLKKEGMI